MGFVDILWWILVIVLFLSSYAGIIFPIIPAPLVIWGGFLVYHFAINNEPLTAFFWWSMVVLTVIVIVADIIANSYFVKKYGGSKRGEWAAAIGVIVGSFIIPPFGILIVPTVAVFVVEMLQRRTTEEAFKASIGSLLGFLGGAFAKFVVLTVMIVWFFVLVII
ncbi:uncharacterized protein YqgC (DUF456 family) [Alkalibacillus filiformis]|uniref:Uncharacterized protein YqgC (DUF456 family) n=1 Tax=Alkalibacillus filiformis TaxID=200990 RepID=A0ABU0DV97_9BACI|nr:DUF456 family protein [Alkalibacillus filiformis]MDQ0352075.1 uncharacterized protein YqgC (DUF456 family) [Alkalibacillus filiformis]